MRLWNRELPGWEMADFARLARSSGLAVLEGWASTTITAKNASYIELAGNQTRPARTLVSFILIAVKQRSGVQVQLHASLLWIVVTNVALGTAASLWVYGAARAFPKLIQGTIKECLLWLLVYGALGTPWILAFLFFARKAVLAFRDWRVLKRFVSEVADHPPQAR